MLFSFLSFVGAVFGCFFKSGTIDLGCEMREEEAEPSLFLPPSLDENKKTWYYWLVCDVTWLYLHPFVSTAGELSVCFPPSPPVRLSAIQSENNNNNKQLYLWAKKWPLLGGFDVVFSFFLLETSQTTLIKPSREHYFLPPPSSSRIMLELFSHYLFEDEMK